MTSKLHCCRIIGGGETLPRLKGSNNMKPKPVAKIIANTRSSIPVNSEEIERDWEEVWSIQLQYLDLIVQKNFVAK